MGGNMQEWSAVIKTITDKIGEFLNIFDLSFLVSGAACLSGIYCIYITFYTPFNSINVPIAIMFAYILGLMCFTLGRWVRKDLSRNRYADKFNNRMQENIHAHNVAIISEYSTYFKNERIEFEALYVRMWADLREAKDAKSSLGIINRYWVMSATYDGLAVTCLVWLVALELWWRKNGISVLSSIITNAEIACLQVWISILMIPLALFIAYRCIVEADRYSKHQVQEVIATIVSWKNSHKSGTA